MPASEPPSPVLPEESGPLVLRFGTAVGLATAAALVCALPATMRISAALAGGPSWGRVWLALASAALGPMTAAVVVLRGAREGLRAFGGPGAGLRVYGVGLWLVSLFVTLALFGSVLRATTHHHALAGVTFAFGAFALAVGLGLVCVRIVAILRGLPEGTRRATIGLLGVIAVSALVWVGLRFERAASSDASSAAAAGTVVDVLAFALTSLFAARRSFAARKALALVGPPVAVVIAALGLAALHDSALREAIGQRAQTFLPIVELLQGPSPGVR